MVVLRKVVILFFVFLSLLFVTNATQEQVRVEITEDINQVVNFNPLNTGGGGPWEDSGEVQANYSFDGIINVTNQNPNGKTISDIYISLINTTNLLSTPANHSGRNGTFLQGNVATNLLVLHIPELRSGEYSAWNYTVNSSSIRPPLNFTSNYSATKVLAGDNITVTDTLHNVYDNASYQQDTCIQGIVIDQSQVPVNFSGVFQNFTFLNTSTTGPDSTNVTYDQTAGAENQRQVWDVLNGGCLNKNELTYISYDVSTPLNVPATRAYSMINSTLEYQLNGSISQMRVSDITAISEANLSFDKQIISASDPVLHGSNVTWNVTGYFSTGTNISYNLTYVTFWVSQRNVNGVYTDPNTIDNDTISSASLNISETPNSIVNSSQQWTSSNWLFNYSDIPSPIVWMDLNFSILADGTQLVNRSITRNGSDTYIKELYLIIGYWLEIEKNVTSIGADQYNVRIDVRNRGNQVTPADAIVTIYDFVPVEFNLSSGRVIDYSSSPWYTTSEVNTSISGAFNGTLYQWALIPTNPLNTSLAQGPAINQNTTWSAEFNVTGTGDYTVLDIFVTGLDPQQVDGAGSTKSVVVSQIIEKLKSTEGVFAVVAGVLLLLGLLA